MRHTLRFCGVLARQLVNADVTLSNIANVTFCLTTQISEK